jgi:hypothetical protein
LPLDELPEAVGVLERLIESCCGTVGLDTRGVGACAGVIHVALEAGEAVLEALDKAARVDLGQLAQVELDCDGAGLERDGHQPEVAVGAGTKVEAGERPGDLALAREELTEVGASFGARAVARASDGRVELLAAGVDALVDRGSALLRFASEASGACAG